MDVGLVCGSCDTFNEMGAKSCVRCDSALALGPSSDRLPAAHDAVVQRAPASSTAPQATRAETEPCPVCGQPVLVGHRFCGTCGASIERGPGRDGKTTGRKTMFFGAMQAARAKLVLIRGDGLDGVSFTLAGKEHVAGREDGSLLFEDDPYLSRVHANFLYRDGNLVVRDESSANGVYVRIRGSTQLEFGNRFLVGEQVLEVRATPPDVEPKPEDDGTYFFASPRRAADFRVVQLLRGGDTGLAYLAQSDTVTLGREGNDINFPDDPFISGHHAEVACRDDQLTLEDAGSKNGTFVRINHERPLTHGDYVFMGQQLLRVEIV